MSHNIVFITGANQGLGFEIAKKLARETSGYTIILGSRDLLKGQTAASEIADIAKGNIVDVAQIDVCSDESIFAAAKSVEAKYGHLDVLVNNAGIDHSPCEPFRQQMLDSMFQLRQVLMNCCITDTEIVYNTNVAGVVVTTNAFIPLLKKSTIPRIVLMSSDLGSLGNTLDSSYRFYGIANTPYKCSKAALNMLGAILSVDYRTERIRVNIVNPGFRQTNMNGYHHMAGKVEDGALEAFKFITMGDQGETGTYTEIEGSIRW